ncbi:MAG: DNA mismatch endonuclease Vsr [Gemmatimonadetes bacterium]|nr:DNA mismatch endonuclease Vsr [Gemmatimonadota bacterium]MYG15881.1 DNA mismatch endonuclease Vsr [Gemmatimonadota bacterium]
MSDRISQADRSRVMRRIGAKNTVPEMRVRRLIHKMGYRYRLHRRDLPGSPDIVFVKQRRVIFVHGCFWHQHDCPRGTRPVSNTRFWNSKLQKNVERDRQNIAALTSAGWCVLVVWECQTKSTVFLANLVKRFLD